MGLTRLEIEERITQRRLRIRELAKEYELAIAEQSRSITKLQHTLNSLTLAGSLPPELLVKVFTFCTPSPSLERYRVPDPYKWIHVSHVCHYWRMIALSNVQLWTFVAPRGTEQARELLSRSRQMLIDVQSLCNLDRHLPCLSVLLEQLPRTRILSLIADYRVHSVALSQVAAPHLKAITLINSGGHEPLPRFVYQICPLSLEHLVLSGWSFSWGCSVFRPTIVRLAISVGRPRPVVFTSPHVWEQMLEALDSMPLLQSLDIKNILPQPPFPTTKRIELPNLSSLHITDTGVSCGHFLSSVDCPTSLSISLDLGTETPLTDFTDLISLSTTQLSWGSTIPSWLRSLSLATVSNRITIKGFSGLIDAREMGQPKHDPQLRITMGLYSTDDIARILLLLPPGPLEHVDSCFIKVSPPASIIRHSLIAFSEKLPHLTSLAVCGTDSAVLLPRMLHRPSMSSPDDPALSEFSFPRLRTLALVDVNFSKLKPEDRALMVALQERRRRNLTLRKIQLWMHGISSRRNRRSLRSSLIPHSKWIEGFHIGGHRSFYHYRRHAYNDFDSARTVCLIESIHYRIEGFINTPIAPCLSCWDLL